MHARPPSLYPGTVEDKLGSGHRERQSMAWDCSPCAAKFWQGTQESNKSKYEAGLLCHCEGISVKVGG